MLAGPDVSSYQGTIAWPRVRLSEHELAFAIAKCSEASNWIDPTFAHNWTGIRERGLIRGAYHFARPGVSGPATARAVRAEATAEAEHMLSVLHEVGGIGEGDLPPALDLEVSRGLTAAQVYDWADTWVHIVQSSIGRTPMIYTGGFWKSTLGSYTDAWGCPLWLAQYAPAPQLPRAWKTWTLWQCTDAAHLDGIAGGVDLSYFNGSHRELEELAGSSARAHAVTGQHGQHRRPSHADARVPRWPGRALKLGVQGADVRQWQLRMVERGFEQMRTDGVFDEHCAESCRWLQLYLRYPPTEQVDEAGWHATWVAP